MVHWGSHAGYSWNVLALRIVPIVDDSISWCRPQTLGFQPESLRIWYSPLQFLLQRRYTVRRGLRWRILHHSVIIQELLHEAESLVCGTTLSLMQRFVKTIEFSSNTSQLCKKSRLLVSASRISDSSFPRTLSRVFPGTPTQGHARRVHSAHFLYKSITINGHWQEEKK